MFESLDYKTGSAPWLFKSFSQSLLLNSLKKVEGEKDVIISPELIQPLDLLVSFSKLKECGVQKVYRLLDGDCEGAVQKRIFLVNNHASIANMVANKINAERSVRPETQFWVFSVPRTTRICKLIFEEQGILGDIQCIDFPLSFIPLDSDLFSLEQDSIYAEFFLRKNFSPVSNIAKALEQIGLIFGTASRVTGIGKLSSMALKINETLYKETIDSSSSYEHLIVIDRDLDYHSLLLSSLNYQGLLDESFGIRCSRIDIPDSLAQKIQVRKYNAQSVDPIFKLIRDSHLSLASSNLKKIASEMSDNPLKSKDMSISQMREFVQTELRNRKALQTSLRLHISLCEIIMDKKKELEFASQLVLERSIFCGKDYRDSVSSIESMIERQLDPIHCLRTLVLLSCCNDGLPSRDYTNLVRLFLQSFGHQYLVAFHNLSKLNLLVRQPSPANFLASPTSSVTGVISQTRVLSALPKRIHFRNMVRRLSLSPIENDSSASSSTSKLFVHKDAGSVFGDTYIPIIYRITEIVTNNLHNTIIEQLNELSKYTFYRESSGIIPKTKCIVIFFTAGASYAEISALRHLSLQMKKDIIILTTNIINGCSFISNLTQFKSS